MLLLNTIHVYTLAVPERRGDGDDGNLTLLLLFMDVHHSLNTFFFFFFFFFFLPNSINLYLYISVLTTIFVYYSTFILYYVWNVHTSVFYKCTQQITG